jgi:hypothetical protein
MKAWLVACSGAFVVTAVMVVTPIVMKPPPKPQPKTESTVPPNVRQIPLTKQDLLKSEPSFAKQPPIAPQEKKPENVQPELPEKHHYRNGSDICARTGGYKVTLGKSWRCRYR